MSTTQKTLTMDTIRDRLEPLFRERKEILKGIIFGSFARGKQSRKSDIDLMLVVRTDKRFFDRYEGIKEIYEKLKEYQIDVLIYTPEEIESMAHRRFIQSALSEGVVIYER